MVKRLSVCAGSKTRNKRGERERDCGRKMLFRHGIGGRSNGVESSYPELYAVVGSRVPDLRNRMLQGSSSPGSYLSAGLPNITGEIGPDGRITERNLQFLSEDGVYTNGAFFIARNVSTYHIGDYINAQAIAPKNLLFNASRSNSIYGNSSTVQPPAYTARFLIRAKS